MPKLHELLAVDSTLKNQASVLQKELAATFANKAHHFEKKVVTFKSDEPDVGPVTESQLDIQTTVAKEIGWINNKTSRAINIGHQIDVANTAAKADVVLDDGTVFLKDVPATSLLQLEKRLQKILQLTKTIKTLDPAKGFTLDANEGVGIYKARDVNKIRTKLMTKVLTLVPPTDKHPGQAQPYQENVRTGEIEEMEWSALIPTSVKAELLDKCEELIRAVKKARSRANDIDFDVAGYKIGDAILAYIYSPISASQ